MPDCICLSQSLTTFRHAFRSRGPFDARMRTTVSRKGSAAAATQRGNAADQVPNLQLSYSLTVPSERPILLQTDRLNGSHAAIRRPEVQHPKDGILSKNKHGIHKPRGDDGLDKSKSSKVPRNPAKTHRPHNGPQTCRPKTRFLHLAASWRNDDRLGALGREEVANGLYCRASKNRAWHI